MNQADRKFIIELQKKPGLRKETGLFIAEGSKAASELDSSDIEKIYVTEDFIRSGSNSGETLSIKRLTESGLTEIIRESDMRQISDTVNPQGILAVVKQKRAIELKELLSCRPPGAGDAPLILALETIQDPGNLGTIIRSAEAAGVSAVIMNRETADPYSPKVVRSTVGSILRVPFLKLENLKSAVDDIREGKYTSGEKVQVLSASLDACTDYDDADFAKPSLILIGNESRGLSAGLEDAADVRIRIPMLGKLESLNAAVAASVICFEAARQRRITKS